MNRHAIVTGASRGIGRAIAHRLNEEGWQVTNLDVAPPADTAAEPAPWIEADLTDPDSLAAAIERARETGPILGLVNNAAVALVDKLEETPIADFDRTMALNLRAPFLAAQAVMADMKEARFGRIVNLASRAMLGKTHRTAYAASKGGIAAMARVWALELAEFGITVNAVAPGPIATEMFMAANPPEMPRTQEIIGTVPVGRLGTPEDIAQAVAFFMDERSAFTTGQTLYVCGGITLARGGS